MITKYIKKHLHLLEEKEIFSERDYIYFSNVIQFVQHERLIHLIITIISAVFFFAFGALFLLASNVITGILLLIFTILLIFYIKHYCFLENSVQKMYSLYEKIINEKENQTECQTDNNEEIICGMNLKY